LTEVAEAETTPDALPQEYHGLVNLLRRYVEFLRHIVGERSGHYVEVLRIAAEVNTHQHVFEYLGARQITSLLWQIFMDARQFFSTGIDVRGNLPQSLLSTTYNEVAAGIVPAHLNVPYTQLMGQDAKEEEVDASESVGRGTGQTSRESRSYRHVPASIKTVLQGARTKYPSLTVAELMAANVPPLTYSQVKLGPSGSCLDFLCFGACKSSRCSYKHPATASIQQSRADAVAVKLQTAWTAYKSAN
jgi:hypothetical protein